MLGFKRTVLFSVAIILIICVTKSMAAKVVIVGAGLAGFSAAAKLIENNITAVLILEAEDRFGGRIKSVPYGNGFIDMGAQWCHGQGRNVIYEMARNNFTFGDSGFMDNDESFHLSSGGLANQAQCARLSALSEKILYENYKAMSTFNGSLGDFFVKKYREALKTSSFSDIPPILANQVLDFQHKEVVNDFASPTWFDISAHLEAESEATLGNQFLTWGTKGFETVFDFITKKAIDPSQYLKVESKIQLKKEVTKINWRGNPIIVTCSDGSNFTAEHVIFTGSLGVLKARYQSLFTPVLPAKKINAIQNIGFGTLGKIFLEFEKPFWPNDPQEFISFGFLWTDADLKSVVESDKAWLVDLNSFARVDGFPNLLEGLLSGRGVSTFEQLNDTKIINDCMWLLQKFLKKSLPQPKKMFRSQWQQSKNFLGSYSFSSMAAEKSNVQAGDMAESLTRTDQNFLLFAGEATDLVFPSYAHGAVSSGWRAGNKLVQFYKNRIIPK